MSGSVKAIIIEDEENNRLHLNNLLKKHCLSVNIVGMAEDAIQGIDLIKEKKPQLVFLDIHLPNGDGFKLLECIPNRNFEVIFVTAYDQYAIKAIRFCALDYLLKPISVIELKNAVEKALLKINYEKESINSRLETFYTNVQNSEKRIGLPSMERIEFVKVSEIVRCQGENNYTHVYLADGRKILVTRTLKEFEELLSEYDFIRVHQSHLVNLKFIKSFEKSDGGYLLLHNGTTIAVSRQRKESVLKHLFL